MGVLLDIIVLLIVLVAIIINIKRGFVKSIIGLISLVLAFVIVSVASKPISEIIYDTFVHDSVCDTISLKQDETSTEGATVLFENLPEFVRNAAESADITEESIADVLSSGISSEDKSAHISQNIIRPAVVTAISIFVDIILFAVLMIIFKLISKFICSFFRIGILKHANKFLGAVLGLIKGIVIAAFVCSIMRYFIESGVGDFHILTESAISESILFKFFSEVL